MAGPAISTARAVPAEAPAANSDRARGISKNEGMVSSSAPVATTIRISTFDPPEASVWMGMRLAMTMETQMPNKIQGTVRTEMYASERKYARMRSPRPSPVSANSSMPAVRTCTGPATRATSAETMTTRTMAITNRIPAMDRGNSRNEKVRAAGFKAGAARVNANDGPKRRLRRYTAGNIGATQQEHNIKGAPDADAASCGLTRHCPNSVAKCRGETVAWTAALMRTPNTSAGQTIFR